MRFEDEGVSFEPPPGWLETTIVTVQKPTKAFAPAAAPEPGGAMAGPEVCSLAMHKELLAEGESVRLHTQRRMIELAEKLEEFEYVATRDWEIDGRPAVVVNFAWTSPLGRLLQSRISLEFARPAPDEPDGPPAQRYVLTFVTSADLFHAIADRVELGEILKTVRVHPRGPSSRGT